MKDKRKILKLACITEFIYIVSKVIYYCFFKKFNDEVMANLFLLLISAFFLIILYRESKKDIEVLKKNKIKIIISSIWLFIDPVIPGVLGFLFIFLISDKKKNNLPVIKEEKRQASDYVKSILLIFIFILIMFVLPRFSFFNKIPEYVIYLVILIIVLLFNFKYIKKDFVIFCKNIKVYLPFIIKRYFIMLLFMILVAVPIVLINNGVTSSNQQVLNQMFKKVPLMMLLLSTLYAPFVEENVFRLSLSKLFNNKILFIVISGFLFGILHMIDKFTSFYDLLYIFQYAALGICLAKAYIDSKNIFTSIGMHFIQNLLAAILVILLY